MTSTAATYQQPAWMEPYSSGERIGFAQAVMAYADYYGVDGSADLDPEVEERLPLVPTPWSPTPAARVRAATSLPCALLGGGCWYLPRAYCALRHALRAGQRCVDGISARRGVR